ncbi:hypothetical protein [Streptomyces sp. NPDC048650]|uniref:hypothetical protein n=1 Tax=Streptomyces sp. NPDC048650 TaxID=3365583 RepID=UPI003710F119
MGIESDQLVFDYLSRVGDLAQQRGLPAATRMQLVAGLRAEIDARKADTVPGVKRVLSRLGTPEEVVTAARSGDAPPTWSPQRGDDGRRGLLGKVPPPREAAGPARPGFLRKAARPAAPETETAAAPPHLAGIDELGEADDPPDWWRVEPAGPSGPVEPAGPYGAEEPLHGFIGGIEIPEIWDRPEDEQDEQDELEAERAGSGWGLKRPLPRTLRRALGRRRAPEEEAAPEETPGAVEPGEAAEEAVGSSWAWLSPVPALAVVLLLAGAVAGSWLALGAGWGLAYVSRRLTRGEAKFAALGMPGTAAGALLVWLWGRADGRWGEPIAQARLGQELLDGLPVAARIAAGASAVFLVWRMRRRPR